MRGGEMGIKQSLVLENGEMGMVLFVKRREIKGIITLTTY
jgi:hypothetical protein